MNEIPSWLIKEVQAAGMTAYAEVTPDVASAAMVRRPICLPPSESVSAAPRIEPSSSGE